MTRWTSTGDTGGAVTGPASSGSPSMGTSSAPPTGRHPCTTTGGLSTRSPVVAPLSRSRSPRATPRSARGRRAREGSPQRAAKVSGKAGRCPVPGVVADKHPALQVGGTGNPPPPCDSVTRKREAERWSEQELQLGEQCPERPSSRRPFLSAPSRWPAGHAPFPWEGDGEGCDTHVLASPLSLPFWASSGVVPGEEVTSLLLPLSGHRDVTQGHTPSPGSELCTWGAQDT